MMTHASEADLQRIFTQERHRVHLVGVAGSGMSGIAALLLELGHEVSGSDKIKTLETNRLQRLGLQFHREHRAEDANAAEFIIYSSAIKEDNPILSDALVAGKPVIRRAEALAAIMSGKRVSSLPACTANILCMASRLRDGGLHPSITSREIRFWHEAHWTRAQFFCRGGR